MKRFVLLAGIASIAFGAAQMDPKDVASTDTQIDAIKEATRPEVPAFRNPFYYPPRPVVVVEGAEPPAAVATPKEPILQSVLGAKALINGEWKKAGEKTIGGWRVQRVLVDSVILINGNSRRTLSMDSGVKKNNYIVKVGG
ncbi:MAG: hypothetical protein LBF86_01190 [Helicobacteraceae bacterium]|jgi:hypothetical protein|nr:hypothetical protein [Helicobacteraceae bacterium]